MVTKGDGVSQFADWLRRLFSAEYGKTKIFVPGSIFLIVTRLGFGGLDGAAVLIPAGVAAAVGYVAMVALIEWGQKLKARKPEERFRQLQPALEAHFRAIEANGSADMLEVDRLSHDLFELGLWVSDDELCKLSAVRRLIGWARRGRLGWAEEKYPPLF